MLCSCASLAISAFSCQTVNCNLTDWLTEQHVSVTHVLLSLSEFSLGKATVMVIPCGKTFDLISHLRYCGVTVARPSFKINNNAYYWKIITLKYLSILILLTHVHINAYMYIHTCTFLYLDP